MTTQGQEWAAWPHRNSLRCKGNNGPFPETMLQWFFDLKKVTDPKDKKAVKPEVNGLLKRKLFLGLKVRRSEARAPLDACLDRVTACG